MGKDGLQVTLLHRLGRAAGLSALATATLASGPCGACGEPYDACASVDDFNTERDRGLAATADAAAGAPNSGGSSSYEQRVRKLRDLAMSWDGAGCPTNVQRYAIAELNSTYAPPGELTASADPGICCYHVVPHCPGGRPFLVGGQARVAELRGAERSAASGPRRALAEAWQADALTEHASVAAFARLSLQLLALGAPAALVQDAQLASLDELRHAEFCFGRAARHAGRSLSAGPLPMAGALDDLSLEALIESNLLEGCIAETLAALRLTQLAQRVADAELRAELLAIGEDEARHAELAFRILAWCRETAPELAARGIERALGQGPPPPPAPLEWEEDELFVAERSTSAETRAGDQRAWRQVLLPLLRALHGGAVQRPPSGPEPAFGAGQGAASPLV